MLTANTGLKKKLRSNFIEDKSGNKPKENNPQKINLFKIKKHRQIILTGI